MEDKEYLNSQRTLDDMEGKRKSLTGRGCSICKGMSFWKHVVRKTQESPCRERRKEAVEIQEVMTQENFVKQDWQEVLVSCNFIW